MNEEPAIDIVAVQKIMNLIPVDCPSVKVEIAPEHEALSAMSVCIAIVIIKQINAEVHAMITPFQVLSVFII